jgi:hypothetical protein
MISVAHKLPPRYVRITTGLAVIFALIAWRSNVRIAVLTTGSFVAGYLLEFYLVRALAALVNGRALRAQQLCFAFVGIAGGGVIICSGVGMVLALVFFCCLFLDAVLWLSARRAWT